MNRQLSSWGRFPYAPQTADTCHWRHEVPSKLCSLVSTQGSTLPYGNGRSYGDSCLAASDHVLSLRSLDRFIQVDWQRGRVVAEAGVTLAQILEISIPKGWFLAVAPGTQLATLGGAIANDVHGKNHHVRGTFGNYLISMGLLRHREEVVKCSASQNSELYSATIGGLGLTGIILWAEIQLIPILSSQIDSVTVRFGSLEEFFSLSAELDAEHEYSVAWIDCLSKGSQVGRGVFIVGDHAHYGSLIEKERTQLVMPFSPPISLINKASLRVFNEVYWRLHPSERALRRNSYESFFFPLDRINNWNRIYGRKGFQQYQCVIPEAVAPRVMGEVLRVISSSGQGSFLAVLKRCGEIVSPGILSFPMKGTSLALDFPQNTQLASLFERLDSMVHEAGGRLYPAKDAHMKGCDFRRAYPAWQQLEVLRDPTLMSRFWKRVIE